MSALMDTTSKFVFDDHLQDKDEVHDKISWFLDIYITALRGRTGSTYKINLLSDLDEAHSNKIINTCKKIGVLKQTTARYTPDHNAFAERFFRTVGEMFRCRMIQFNLKEELWQDSRSHLVWLLNRAPVSKYAPNQS
jgi:transposase InsO family protein